MKLRKTNKWVLFFYLFEIGLPRINVGNLRTQTTASRIGHRVPLVHLEFVLEYRTQRSHQNRHSGGGKPAWGADQTRTLATGRPKHETKVWYWTEGVPSENCLITIHWLLFGLITVAETASY
ncbi:hypothetical protein Hanom_Chr12g01107361 [Helianthus anomalus]